jgi:hypothetical protein
MRESRSVAALTGTSGATSAQTGILLGLYKFPQVRARVMERCKTMSTLVLFSGV